MKLILLAASAGLTLAAVALTGAPALAAHMKGPTVAGPSQPLPYAQLDAYMKASPKMRKSKDWWSGQTAAATGTSANTSATVSASPSLPADTAPAAPAAAQPPLTSTAPSLPSSPPIDTPPATTVNPPASTAPGAPPTTAPPK